MKKWWVLTATAFVMISSIVSVASAITSILNNETQLHAVASLTEAKATLYAIEREGNYEKFKLELDGTIRVFPDWKNVNNPSYAPKLFFKDINHDAKKELINVRSAGGQPYVNFIKERQNKINSTRSCSNHR